jgi:pyridoxal phosphate enzyme (YggS family)
MEPSKESSAVSRAVLDRLKRNVENVLERVAAAAGRAGRAPGEVTLIAVTKTVSAETAGLLLDAGVEHLGENRVQEGELKHAVLGGRCHWHMIGHLQTNKVKKALRVFRTIHAVDSERLLQEISRRAGINGARPDILLEVNVSGEESKYGLRSKEVEKTAALARELPDIELRGLMTMAPYDLDPEAARPVFKELARIFRSMRETGLGGARFDMLSMGMSGDFETAIEEGATHIRVGTALYEGLEGM